MASVNIVLRKDKLNSKGEAPIHFRITKNRKSSYIASGIHILPSLWNLKKSRLKSTASNSSRINSYLSHKFTEIQDTVLQNETHSKSMTSRSLKEKVFGKTSADFFAFADSVIDQYRKAGQIGTYDKNKSIVGKLRKYRPNLAFHDITSEFLIKYEQYLRIELGNKINTVNKDMKFIRKVFNDAIRQDIIEHQVTPFRGYQLKLEKTHRDFLSEQELTKIDECIVTQGLKIELHKDMFVFAAYTGGLRVSDMLLLNRASFDGSHLHIVIKKTLTQVSIKVPKKGLEILEKYRETDSKSEGFLFPVLSPSINLKNPVEVDVAISRATAHINKNLKIIARKAGINKRISFHVSRHTFAVLALRKGITIDKVSKLMAHSAIRETQVYAKIVNEELDKAMDVFDS